MQKSSLIVEIVIRPDKVVEKLRTLPLVRMPAVLRIPAGQPRILYEHEIFFEDSLN